MTDEVDIEGAVARWDAEADMQHAHEPDAVEREAPPDPWEPF
jgi:hypothetical protein